MNDSKFMEKEKMQNLELLYYIRAINITSYKKTSFRTLCAVKDGLLINIKDVKINILQWH